MLLQLPSQEFQQWRESARRALSLGVPPERFNWQLPDLCIGDERLAIPSAMVPGNFLNFARRVAMHNSEERWAHLYALLWRLHHGEPAVLEMNEDPSVARAWFMYKAVERDFMKMKVFVRFQDRHELRVAWYKPDHFITEELAGYFVKRDPNRVWMLHTPRLTVRWNLKEIEFSSGLADAPRFLVDDHEEVWLRYYRAQFDPARERIRACTRRGRVLRLGP